MSGYLEGVIVLLLLNIIFAYAVYWPLVAGQVNLGIAGFVGVGAYFAAYLSNEFAMPPTVASITGGLVTFAFAIVIAFPILRTKGIYLALATFALGQIVQSSFLNIEIIGGAVGYPVISYAGLPAVAVCTFVVIALTWLLDRTRFGLNLVVVREDEAIADMFGINVRVYQALAFAIGAGFAGFGGGLYGHHFSYVEPQTFSVLFSISTVLLVLLGGTQTVYGPMLGAVFFTMLPELLRGSAEWRYAIFAALIILAMILRPQGLITAHVTNRVFLALLPSKKEKLTR